MATATIYGAPAPNKVFGNAVPGEGNRNGKELEILTYREGDGYATVSLETHAPQQQKKTKSCKS